MYLQKVELQGFKSFANKTALEFLKMKKEKKGVTAIVGPNGSGKSNVADAIRWALGEQSLKLLRSKKSEDVIFFGSNKKTRLGFTEVSLYLNNEDKAMPVDYSEVVITRRLYRDGESEYLINKNKTRLSDILMLLAQANFGQRTYSVIGQGMVDLILSISPLERKEFFDEAAGVSQFQIKRGQAKSKLLATQENLKQATALLGEIEPRLRSLTRQVKKLERREEIERELKELQKQYYGALWQKISPKVKEQKAKIQNFEKKEGAIKKELEAAKNQLDLLEGQTLRADTFRELQKEYEKLFEEKNKLKEKEIIFRNKIELAKHTSQEVLPFTPVSEIFDELKVFYNIQEALLKKIKTKKILFDEVKVEIAQLHTQFGSFLQKLNKQQNSPKIDSELPKEIEKVAEDIEKINRCLIQVQAKMASFNEKEREEKKKFFELQRTYEEKQSELNELNLKMNDLKIELAKEETRKENLESEINQELGGVSEIFSVNLDTKLSTEEIFPQIIKLKHQLELIGGIDQEVEKEYHETKKRHDFLSSQSEDLLKATSSLQKMIDELDEMIQKQFNNIFKQINQEFEKYFKILFGGGRAELVLQKQSIKEEDNNTDDSSLEEEKISGIEIYVNLPGKRLKNINILSGGERALVSIALICAIISCNPSPFVVLDEVDAALDELNSIKFANILENLSSKTQFIIITHNRATMQKANVLYGVTMSSGISKLLSINLEEAEKEIK